MTSSEVLQVVTWVSENIGNLPREDQIYVIHQYERFAVTIKPIYDKHVVPLGIDVGAFLESLLNGEDL